MTKLTLVSSNPSLQTDFYKDRYENEFYKVDICGDSEGVTKVTIRNKNSEAPEIKVVQDDDNNFRFRPASPKNHTELKRAYIVIQEIEGIIKKL